MKKRGIVIGLLFVALMALVFQAEIKGLMTSVRERAYDAADADQAVISALPALDEDENGTGDEGTPPPLPDGTEEPGEDGEDTEDTEDVTAELSYSEVSLYFVDENSGAVSAETRSVASQGGIARATMEQLLTGPADSSLASYIPANTQVLDIAISEDGLCTIDLSGDIQQAQLDSRQERFVIESIVETLSQFDTVQQVQIKVDGAVCKSLTGHWDISKPLSVNDL